jgi:hypothetical protein
MPIGAAVSGAVVGVGAAVSDNRNAKRSRDSAERQREESQAFIEKNIKQARGDLFKLLPQAQESRRLGAQAGMDLLGQTIPQQIESFQGGNVAAQNMLIQGLPQQQNAILGRGTSFNPQAVQLGGGINMPQLPNQVQIQPDVQPQPQIQEPMMIGAE